LCAASILTAESCKKPEHATLYVYIELTKRKYLELHQLIYFKKFSFFKIKLNLFF
jgi:hypothetical protein